MSTPAPGPLSQLPHHHHSRRRPPAHAGHPTLPQSRLPRFRQPYRPEAEPHFALPYHEFGLDVMALVGRLRHAEHRSIPEIHQELTRRGLVVAQRTVTHLLDRYDELRALASADPERLGPLLRQQHRVLLAIDG